MKKTKGMKKVLKKGGKMNPAIKAVMDREIKRAGGKPQY